MGQVITGTLLNVFTYIEGHPHGSVTLSSNTFPPPLLLFSFPCGCMCREMAGMCVSHSS